MEIELGPFYQGVACGREVADAHADVPFQDASQRAGLFWFAAGMVAATKYHLDNLDSEFILGVATQAPEPVQS